MSAVLVLFVIFCIWCFLRYIRKQEVYLNDYRMRNLPLQYMYLIDEWYKLRLRFDQEIETSWNKYRDRKISREEYRQESWAAMKRIIPADKRNTFQNLYRYGCYLAAMKMIDEGYLPGYMEWAVPDNREMLRWRPTEYISDTPNNRGSWMRCIPGEHSMLDLYPDGQYLDYMGCGRMRNHAWTPEIRSDSNCASYYTNLYTSDVSKEREKVVAAYVKRGFNGYRYTNEPERNYKGLTQQEVVEKYEFINHKPDMMVEDKDAWCPLVINEKHYKLNLFRNTYMYTTID